MEASTAVEGLRIERLPEQLGQGLSGSGATLFSAVGGCGEYDGHSPVYLSP